jgi:glycosyltransferase involved in cell wall biosynthesis
MAVMPKLVDIVRLLALPRYLIRTPSFTSKSPVFLVSPVFCSGRVKLAHSKRIKAAADSPCRNDIFFTGQFPSKSLPELTSGADIVVFPSLYEGFGLGVLEAMDAGIPVAWDRYAERSLKIIQETAGR